MHLATTHSNGPSARLEKRAGYDPWWCFLWPPSCKSTPWSGSGGGQQGGGGTGGGNNGGKPQSSSTKVNNPPPATTAKPSPNPPAATSQQQQQPQPQQPAPTTPPTANSPEQNPPAQQQPQPAPSSTPQQVQAPPEAAEQPPQSTAAMPAGASLPVTTTKPIDPVIIQPDPTADNGNGNGPAPTATDGGSSGVGGGGAVPTTAFSPGQTGVPGSGWNPSSSGIPGGTGGGGVGAGTAGSGDGGGGGGGLSSGAIAGIVVALLLFLLALAALLLYKFRRSPPVQRMLAPFSRLGGGAHHGFHPYPSGGDGMSNVLLAGAGATASHSIAPTPQPGQQPPMAESRHLHPLAPVPFAARRSHNRRVSSFTEYSDASSVFTPSPVSPRSPEAMLAPGAVRTSRPVQEPPDPRIVPPGNVRLSRGSSFRSFVSSISTGSAVSAALSPGQMAWPMPPGTPPAIRTPEGPQYVNFQRPGETVVRVNLPPRGRRPGD